MLILLIFQDHVDAKNVDEVIESQWALNFSATMKNEMSTTLLCIAVVTKRNILRFIAKLAVITRQCLSLKQRILNIYSCFVIYLPYIT